MTLNHTINDFATGTYSVTRASTPSVEFGEPVAVSDWEADTAYELGDRVVNDGNTYVCVVAGTSASSGGPTEDDDGQVDNGATWDFVHANEFSIVASVQPANEAALADLAEGQRADDVRNLYCVEELYTKERSGYEADTVSIDGLTFRVTKAQRFTMRGESHYECVVEKVTVP